MTTIRTAQVVPLMIAGSPSAGSPLLANLAATAPAIPTPIIMTASRRVIGWRSRLMASRRSLVSSTASVRAPVRRSQRACSPTIAISTPIHPYPTTVSTTITGPSASAEVPTPSATAIMFAVPPIQLPESAAKPCHASAGSMSRKIRSEIGPPTTIPTVPAATMKSATGPSRMTLRRSTDTMSMKIAKRRR